MRTDHSRKSGRTHIGKRILSLLLAVCLVGVLVPNGFLMTEAEAAGAANTYGSAINTTAFTVIAANNNYSPGNTNFLLKDITTVGNYRIQNNGYHHFIHVVGSNTLIDTMYSPIYVNSGYTWIILEPGSSLYCYGHHATKANSGGSNGNYNAYNPRSHNSNTGWGWGPIQYWNANLNSNGAYYPGYQDTSNFGWPGIFVNNGAYLYILGEGTLYCYGGNAGDGGDGGDGGLNWTWNGGGGGAGGGGAGAGIGFHGDYGGQGGQGATSNNQQYNGGGGMSGYRTYSGYIYIDAKVYAYGGAGGNGGKGGDGYWGGGGGGGGGGYPAAGIGGGGAGAGGGGGGTMYNSGNANVGAPGGGGGGGFSGGGGGGGGGYNNNYRGAGRSTSTTTGIASTTSSKNTADVRGFGGYGGINGYGGCAGQTKIRYNTTANFSSGGGGGGGWYSIGMSSRYDAAYNLSSTTYYTNTQYTPTSGSGTNNTNNGYLFYSFNSWGSGGQRYGGLGYHGYANDTGYYGGNGGHGGYSTYGPNALYIKRTGLVNAYYGGARQYGTGAGAGQASTNGSSWSNASLQAMGGVGFFNTSYTNYGSSNAMSYTYYVTQSNSTGSGNSGYYGRRYSTGQYSITENNVTGSGNYALRRAYNYNDSTGRSYFGNNVGVGSGAGFYGDSPLGSINVNNNNAVLAAGQPYFITTPTFTVDNQRGLYKIQFTATAGAGHYQASNTYVSCSMPSITLASSNFSSNIVLDLNSANNGATNTDSSVPSYSRNVSLTGSSYIYRNGAQYTIYLYQKDYSQIKSVTSAYNVTVTLNSNNGNSRAASATSSNTVQMAARAEDPRNVEAKAVNANNVDVWWDAPAQSYNNYPVVGYQIVATAVGKAANIDRYNVRNNNLTDEFEVQDADTNAAWKTAMGSRAELTYNLGWIDASSRSPYYTDPKGTAPTNQATAIQTQYAAPDQKTWYDGTTIANYASRAFKYRLTGLQWGTVYQVKVYAYNVNGTVSYTWAYVKTDSVAGPAVDVTVTRDEDTTGDDADDPDSGIDDKLMLTGRNDNMTISWTQPESARVISQILPITSITVTRRDRSAASADFTEKAFVFYPANPGQRVWKDDANHELTVKWYKGDKLGRLPADKKNWVEVNTETELPTWTDAQNSYYTSRTTSGYSTAVYDWKQDWTAVPVYTFHDDTLGEQHEKASTNGTVHEYVITYQNGATAEGGLVYKNSDFYAFEPDTPYDVHTDVYEDNESFIVSWTDAFNDRENVSSDAKSTLSGESNRNGVPMTGYYIYWDAKKLITGVERSDSVNIEKSADKSKEGYQNIPVYTVVTAGDKRALYIPVTSEAFHKGEGAERYVIITKDMLKEIPGALDDKGNVKNLSGYSFAVSAVNVTGVSDISGTRKVATAPQTVYYDFRNESTFRQAEVGSSSQAAELAKADGTSMLVTWKNPVYGNDDDGFGGETLYRYQVIITEKNDEKKDESGNYPTYVYSLSPGLSASQAYAPAKATEGVDSYSMTVDSDANTAPAVALDSPGTGIGNGLPQISVTKLQPNTDYSLTLRYITVSTRADGKAADATTLPSEALLSIGDSSTVTFHTWATPNYPSNFTVVPTNNSGEVEIGFDYPQVETIGADNVRTVVKDGSNTYADDGDTRYNLFEQKLDTEKFTVTDYVDYNFSTRDGLVTSSQTTVNNKTVYNDEINHTHVKDYNVYVWVVDDSNENGGYWEKIANWSALVTAGVREPVVTGGYSASLQKLNTAKIKDGYDVEYDNNAHTLTVQSAKLKDGTPYYFIVTAVNDSADKGANNSLKGETKLPAKPSDDNPYIIKCTPRRVADAPTIGFVNTGFETVTLDSIDPPQDGENAYYGNGGSEIIGYRIYAKEVDIRYDATTGEAEDIKEYYDPDNEEGTENVIVGYDSEGKAIKKTVTRLTADQWNDHSAELLKEIEDGGALRSEVATAENEWNNTLVKATNDRNGKWMLVGEVATPGEDKSLENVTLYSAEAMTPLLKYDYGVYAQHDTTDGYARLQNGRSYLITVRAVTAASGVAAKDSDPRLLFKDDYKAKIDSSTDNYLYKWDDEHSLGGIPSATRFVRVGMPDAPRNLSVSQKAGKNVEVSYDPAKDSSADGVLYYKAYVLEGNDNGILEVERDENRVIQSDTTVYTDEPTLYPKMWTEYPVTTSWKVYTLEGETEAERYRNLTATLHKDSLSDVLIQIAAVNAHGESPRRSFVEAIYGGPTTPEMYSAVTTSDKLNLAWYPSTTDNNAIWRYQILVTDISRPSEPVAQEPIYAKIPGTTDAAAYVIDTTTTDTNGSKLFAASLNVVNTDEAYKAGENVKLIAGRSYQVEIRAVLQGDYTKTSIYSEPMEFTYGLPPAPEIIGVSYGANSVDISFRAHKSMGITDESVTLAGFVIYADGVARSVVKISEEATIPELVANKYPGFNWAVAEVDEKSGAAASETYQDTVYKTTVTGLVNGQTYSFQVSTVSTSGEGVLSDPETGMPRDRATAPIDYTVEAQLDTVNNDTQVELQWKQPKELGGSDKVDYYKVGVYQKAGDSDELVGTLTLKATRDDATAYTAGIEETTITATGQQTTTNAVKKTTIRGLDPNTTYGFKVYAVTNASDSAIEGYATETKYATTYTAPGAPTITGWEDTVSGSDTFSLKVSWDAPAEDGGTPILYYYVKYMTLADYQAESDKWSSSQKVYAKDGISSYSETLYNLAYGDSYVILVEAVNGYDTDTGTKDYVDGTRSAVRQTNIDQLPAVTNVQIETLIYDNDPRDADIQALQQSAPYVLIPGTNMDMSSLVTSGGEDKNKGILRVTFDFDDNKYFGVENFYLLALPSSIAKDAKAYNGWIDAYALNNKLYSYGAAYLADEDSYYDWVDGASVNKRTNSVTWICPYQGPEMEGFDDPIILGKVAAQVDLRNATDEVKTTKHYHTIVTDPLAINDNDYYLVVVPEMGGHLGMPTEIIPMDMGGPNRPTNVEVTAIDDRQIFIHWRQPLDDNSVYKSLKGYKLYLDGEELPLYYAPETEEDISYLEGDEKNLYQVAAYDGGLVKFNDGMIITNDTSIRGTGVVDYYNDRDANTIDYYYVYRFLDDKWCGEEHYLTVAGVNAGGNDANVYYVGVPSARVGVRPWTAPDATTAVTVDPDSVKNQSATIVFDQADGRDSYGYENVQYLLYLDDNETPISDDHVQITKNNSNGTATAVITDEIPNGYLMDESKELILDEKGNPQPHKIYIQTYTEQPVKVVVSGESEKWGTRRVTKNNGTTTLYSAIYYDTEVEGENEGETKTVSVPRDDHGYLDGGIRKAYIQTDSNYTEITTGQAVAPAVTVQNSTAVTEDQVAKPSIYVQWNDAANRNLDGDHTFKILLKDSDGKDLYTFTIDGSALTEAKMSTAADDFAYAYSFSAYGSTELDGSKRYQIQVQTLINGEAGPWSEAQTVDPGSPSAPEFTSVVASDSKVDLTWKAGKSNGAAATTYYVITANDVDGNVVKTVNVYGADATEKTITDLRNGMTYTFTIVAVNSAIGASPMIQSMPTISKAVTPGAAPSAPKNLELVALGRNTATLSWEMDAYAGQEDFPVTEFVLTDERMSRPIYRVDSDKDAETGEYSLATTATTDIYGITHYTMALDSFLEGETYEIRIAAKNAIGQTASETTQKITTLTTPAVPEILTIASGSGNLAITWKSPTVEQPTLETIDNYTITVYKATNMSQHNREALYTIKDVTDFGVDEYGQISFNLTADTLLAKYKAGQLAGDEIASHLSDDDFRSLVDTTLLHNVSPNNYYAITLRAGNSDIKDSNGIKYSAESREVFQQVTGDSLVVSAGYPSVPLSVTFKVNEGEDGVGSTDATITWRAPSSMNGDLKEYQVYMTAQDDDSATPILVYSGTPTAKDGVYSANLAVKTGDSNLLTKWNDSVKVGDNAGADETNGDFYKQTFDFYVKAVNVNGSVERSSNASATVSAKFISAYSDPKDEIPNPAGTIPVEYYTNEDRNQVVFYWPAQSLNNGNVIYNVYDFSGEGNTPEDPEQAYTDELDGLTKSLLRPTTRTDDSAYVDSFEKVTESAQKVRIKGAGEDATDKVYITYVVNVEPENHAKHVVWVQVVNNEAPTLMSGLTTPIVGANDLNIVIFSDGITVIDDKLLYTNPDLNFDGLLDRELPSAPYGLEADVAADNTQFTVSWKYKEDTVLPAATKFVVTVDGVRAGEVEAGTVTAGQEKTYSFTHFAALTGNKNYAVTVDAYKDGQIGGGASLNVYTPLATAPKLTKDNVTTDVDSATIQVTWDAPDNAENVGSYVVELNGVRQNPSASNVTIDANKREATISALQLNTTYVVRVGAVGSDATAATAYSSSVSVMLEAVKPDAPFMRTLSVSDGKLTVSWRDIQQGLTYKVYVNGTEMTKTVGTATNNIYTVVYDIGSDVTETNSYTAYVEAYKTYNANQINELTLKSDKSNVENYSVSTVKPGAASKVENLESTVVSWINGTFKLTWDPVLLPPRFVTVAGETTITATLTKNISNQANYTLCVDGAVTIGGNSTNISKQTTFSNGSATITGLQKGTNYTVYVTATRETASATVQNARSVSQIVKTEGEAKIDPPALTIKAYDNEAQEAGAEVLTGEGKTNASGFYQFTYGSDDKDATVTVSIEKDGQAYTETVSESGDVIALSKGDYEVVAVVSDKDNYYTNSTTLTFKVVAVTAPSLTINHYTPADDDAEAEIGALIDTGEDATNAPGTYIIRAALAESDSAGTEITTLSLKKGDEAITIPNTGVVTLEEGTYTATATATNGDVTATSTVTFQIAEPAEEPEPEPEKPVATLTVKAYTPAVEADSTADPPVEAKEAVIGDAVKTGEDETNPVGYYIFQYGTTTEDATATLVVTKAAEAADGEPTTVKIPEGGYLNLTAGTYTATVTATLGEGDEAVSSDPVTVTFTVAAAEPEAGGDENETVNAMARIMGRLGNTVNAVSNRLLADASVLKTLTVKASSSGNDSEAVYVIWLGSEVSNLQPTTITQDVESEELTAPEGATTVYYEVQALVVEVGATVTLYSDGSIEITHPAEEGKEPTTETISKTALAAEAATVENGSTGIGYASDVDTLKMDLAEASQEETGTDETPITNVLAPTSLKLSGSVLTWEDPNTGLPKGVEVVYKIYYNGVAKDAITAKEYDFSTATKAFNGAVPTSGTLSVQTIVNYGAGNALSVESDLSEAWTLDVATAKADKLANPTFKEYTTNSTGDKMTIQWTHPGKSDNGLDVNKYTITVGDIAVTLDEYYNTFTKASHTHMVQVTEVEHATSAVTTASDGTQTITLTIDCGYYGISSNSVERSVTIVAEAVDQTTGVAVSSSATNTIHYGYNKLTAAGALDESAPKDADGDGKADETSMVEPTTPADNGVTVVLNAEITAGGAQEATDGETLVQPTVAITDADGNEIECTTEVTWSGTKATVVATYKVNPSSSSTYTIKITKPGCTWIEISGVPMTETSIDLNDSFGALDMYAGDCNRDGEITMSDSDAAYSRLGSGDGTEPGIYGDGNGDGEVTMSDSDVAMSNLGRSSDDYTFTWDNN